MKSKKFNFILLLLFTALVLYFSLKDNFSDVMSYIIKMNPIWFIIAFLLMVVYWLFKAIITREYVKNYKSDYTLVNSFRLQLETMFFNGVTPFSTGGGPFQILSLKKDGVRVSQGANVMVVTSFLHQTSLATFMMISVLANHFLTLFAKSNLIRNLSLLGFIICIIFMGFLLLIMFNRNFNKAIARNVIKLLNKAHIVKNKDEMIKKWYAYIESISEGSTIIKKDKQKFLKCYIYGLIAMLAYISVTYAVAKGMGLNIELYKVIIATSYVQMIGMFVPIPGGTGGLELAFTNLYANFISGSLISSLMLVWRFITYYLGIVLGGIVLNLKKGSR